MLNLKFASVILTLLGVTLLTTLIFPKSAEAQFNNPSYAKASLVDARYATGLDTQSLKARDAMTYEDDKRLTNSCIEGGQDKTDCLCLTRIFKYELSLRDYKAVSFMFNQDINNMTPKLLKSGFSSTEISKLKNLEKTVQKSADFRSRCFNAKTYYSADDKG